MQQKYSWPNVSNIFEAKKKKNEEGMREKSLGMAGIWFLVKVAGMKTCH